MQVKRRQNLAETDRRSYHNKEEWIEEFLEGEGAFYNGSESGDSDNEDENNNENNDQQQLPEGFANSCYKIVPPILLLELINDFVVCNHCSRTLLLVEDVGQGFGNQNYISRSGRYNLEDFAFLCYVV